MTFKSRRIAKATLNLSSSNFSSLSTPCVCVLYCNLSLKIYGNPNQIDFIDPHLNVKCIVLGYGHQPILFFFFSFIFVVTCCMSGKAPPLKEHQLCFRHVCGPFFVWKVVHSIASQGPRHTSTPTYLQRKI